ncbi:hypothetical protein BpHYR1_005224, partial [Brachionus plicatilis]
LPKLTKNTQYCTNYLVLSLENSLPLDSYLSFSFVLVQFEAKKNQNDFKFQFFDANFFEESLDFSLLVTDGFHFKMICNLMIYTCKLEFSSFYANKAHHKSLITTLRLSWSAYDQVFRLVLRASKNKTIGFFNKGYFSFFRIKDSDNFFAKSFTQMKSERLNINKIPLRFSGIRFKQKFFQWIVILIEIEKAPHCKLMTKKNNLQYNNKDFIKKIYSFRFHHNCFLFCIVAERRFYKPVN